MMRQKGFTLLEQLVVLSITGVIVLVVAASYILIWKGRTDIVQTDVALTDIDGAVHWLSRDLVLAQTTNLTDGGAAVSSVNMTWSDLTHWAGDAGTVDHSAIYTLSGTTLLRTYDGDVSTVGRHLTNFGISISGRMFTVTLTSQPGLPGSKVTKSVSIQERSEPAP